MKKTLALFAVAMTLGMSTLAIDAQAKRLGGGKSGGMQRQATTAPATPPAGNAGKPGAPAQATPAAGAAATAAPGAAAAPKRSWMGPVAGLAAGLGLAALASHLGFGEALANMMMIGLLVMAVLLVIGLVMRKRAASQGPAFAGASGGSGGAWRSQQDAPARETYRSASNVQPAGGSQIGSRIGASLGSLAGDTRARRIPDGFDAAAFARNAKSQFLELQAANDAGDLNRLGTYLTPQMLELVRDEISQRGNAAPQQTQVFGLDANVLAVEEENGQYIASVRFTGSVRDQPGATPDDLDEIWHLTKPVTGRSGWVIAGIEQRGV